MSSKALEKYNSTYVKKKKDLRKVFYCFGFYEKICRPITATSHYPPQPLT